MTLRTFRPISRLPRPPRSLLAVRALVPLALLALMTAPFPAPFPLVSSACAQNQLWVTQFGTIADDLARGLAPDGSGGVMIGGWTEGSLGGPSAGGLDSFLARHDSAGNQLWLSQFGTIGSERIHALAPASGGDVFTVGENGSRDAVITRHDNAGNQIWIRTITSRGRQAAITASSDSAGGVFVAGYTTGNLGGIPAVRRDAFLARYDGDGNQLWIRQWDFCFSCFHVANALVPDGDGGVFVSGQGLGDFVARYSAGGERLWFRIFDAESILYMGLASDGSGGIVVGGFTRNNLGGQNAGGNDAYLIRYDGAGNQLWLRQFGTSGYDGVTAMSPDGAGGVIVAGSLDLSGFLARYDSAGNRLWIRQLGAAELTSIKSLMLDGFGHVYAVGNTRDSLGGPNAGAFDAFLALYEIDSCYPDCDTSTGIGILDIFDFLCFQNSFVLGEPYACDCDPDPACDIFDFLCFQSAFVAGCP